MTIDIHITRRKEFVDKCIFCERDVSGEFYDLDIEYEDDKRIVGRYRRVCLECHCALKKQFTGVD